MLLTPAACTHHFEKQSYFLSENGKKDEIINLAGGESGSALGKKLIGR